MLHPFRPRLIDALKGYTLRRLFADFGAGLTVSVVALPLAMAFAIASGVKPEQGLITAIVAGFLISALGGSNVQIGGPAGAFIVVVYGIVQTHGLTNLLIATALAGVLLFLMGLLRLGALVRHVPVAIVVGFTNGIAVLIAFAQIKELLGLNLGATMPSDFSGQLQTIVSHLDTVNWHSLAIGSVCVLMLFAWPRAFTANSVLPAALLEGRTLRTASRVPGPLVAIVVLTVLSYTLALPVETIGSRFGGIPQSLPSLELPPFSWESAKQLVFPTLTIALLGAIESLLCARIADNMADMPRHDPNQELMAQGVANMVVPFFGGLPATGTIARTVTNIRAGASTPIAGIVHALALAAVVLLAAPWAAHVPLAALAGIALYAAWNMGEWHEFARLRRFNLAYRAVLLATFLLTVFIGLVVAVQVGLVMACISFIYNMSTLFRVEVMPPARLGVHVVRLYGALFFGAVDKIDAATDDLPEGTRWVVLDMHQLVKMDHSGLDALMQLHRGLRRHEVQLILCSVNAQPQQTMRDAGLDSTLDAPLVSSDLAAAFARIGAPAAAPVSAMLSASAVGEKVGFLEQLKRQADAVRDQDTVDTVSLERNTALADAACKTVLQYWMDLAAHLNVLQPAVGTRFSIDTRTAIEGVKRCDFSVDSRRKMLRGQEVYDHAVLHGMQRSGAPLTMSKDFPPEIERLETRLRQAGVKFDTNWVRQPESGRLEQVEFNFIGDLTLSARAIPLHDEGMLRFQFSNFDDIETLSIDFPAYQVGSELLDNLARWIVGEPQDFIKQGKNLRIQQS